MTLFLRGGPPLFGLFVIAGVIGFGLGTWLGNVTRPTSVAAVVQPSPTVIATPSPSPSASPTPTPTETLAPSLAPPQPQQVILTVEGDSHDVSDAFEVKPGWQIQWHIDGSSIAIAVTGDSNLGVLVEKPGPASGVTGVAQGGAFRLEIVATGPWRITVIDGQDPTPSAS
jgi:hypothetical protein